MTRDEHEAERGLRRLFVDAAREILAEPDTSLDLRKVAERAGKSRTAPYLAFGKADEGGGLPALQAAVAAEGFDALAEALAEAVDRAPSGRHALHAMATAYLRFASDHPRLFRLMFGPEVGAVLGSRATSEAPAREQAALRAARRRLQEVIQRTIEAQAPGYFSGGESLVDAETVTGAVWAMLHGVATLTLDQQWGLGELVRGPSPDELARRVLQFLTSESARALEEAAAWLVRAQEHKELEQGPDAFLRARESSAPYISSRYEASPSPALLRARMLAPRLQGARILWIDDRPDAVRPEIVMLERLGMRVAQASTTDQALARLRQERFDLVISDIDREDQPDEGVRALPALHEVILGAPVVFYVGRLDPAKPRPPGALGITDDPEELLELVMDGVVRTA